MKGPTANVVAAAERFLLLHEELDPLEYSLY